MKSEFLTNLGVQLKYGSDHIWVVSPPLVYTSQLLNCTIIVPSGYEIEGEGLEEPLLFETDFASVPRVPIFYEMWGDRAHREAVLHDYLYRKNSIPVVTKHQADKVFLEAMISTGKPWYISRPMYYGVVFGGGSSYHKLYVRSKLC